MATTRRNLPLSLGQLCGLGAGIALIWTVLAVAPSGLLGRTGEPGQLQETAGKESLEQQIAEAIERLGHPKYHARESATKFLWSLGKAAEPALRQAVRDSDPEVVRRAQYLLEQIRYGILPDTPKEVVALVKRYKDGTTGVKLNVIRELLAMGSKGYPVLLALSSAEEDDDVRRAVFRQLRPHVTKIVPPLLAAGEFSRADSMLELAAAAGIDSSIRDYAAFLLLTGRLDAKVRYLDAGGSPDAQSARRLAYLHRARGDLGSAGRAAMSSSESSLLRSILLERCDWAALARTYDQPPGRKDIEDLGFRAAYCRLTGRYKDFASAIAEIHKLAREEKDGSNTWFCAEALLLNDRPDEAIELFIRDNHYDSAFLLLCARLRFSEAFELVEKARSEKQKDLLLTEVAFASVLRHLGEEDKARQILSKLLGQTKQDRSGLAKLIQAEVRSGLTDQAFEHCAAALARLKSNEDPYRLLAYMFPKRPTEASVWWAALRRKSPKQGHNETLGQLRSLLEGKTATQALVALAKDAEAAAAELPKKEEAQWLHAISTTLEATGNEQLALIYLTRAASTSSSCSYWTDVGDFLAKRKRWEQAAKEYDSACQANPSQPVPLYMRGWALAQSGQKEEGEKLMRLAVLLPLADEAGRHSLAGALDQHGLSEAAERQRQLILRTGRFMSWYVGNCLNRRARRAIAEADYSRAARYYERYRLDCLNRSTFCPNVRGYLVMSASVHSSLARAHLADGRIDKAIEEAHACLAALPADIQVVLDLVPELDKLGHKQDADRLFSKTFELLEAVCREYPRSAHYHNNAAWLAARCNRHLDRALEYGQQAVKLDPDNPAFLDTLAETYFRRGNRERAIQLMKKCITLDPKNSYLQEQLKRFTSENARDDSSRGT